VVPLQRVLRRPTPPRGRVPGSLLLEIGNGLFSYDLRHVLFRMDPLSLTASITALLGATARIIQYLNDIKGASKEKRSLALEAASLLGLLTDLKYRAEEAEQTHDPWYASIRVLGSENGPLEQFRNSLEELAAKLNPSSGYRKAGRSLLWTFDKIDINNILARIERLKALISVALSRDQM
jgi:hypothetical protein